MRTPYTRKLVRGALGLIVLAGLWFAFAPVALGGSTSYVVTEGVSMQPRFHAGDLALVRSQSNYQVGEIVAYRSTEFHTIVLHRIIARAGSRYVFKGDNNNFVDFEHPAASQLIGALWLHVPGAGARLESLRSPWLIGILLAAGTLLFAGAAFTQQRRRRPRQRRSEDSGRGGWSAAAGVVGRRSQATAEPVAGVLATGLAAMLPFLALGLVAFTRPTTALLPSRVPYRQRGTLSYAASAVPGPIYPGNRAVTGDPLFTHVIHSVQLRFAYHLDAADAHSLAGKASLYATIASSSGWRTTTRLGSPTYFRGRGAIVGASVELPALLALLRRVQATTAVSGSYTLTVLPRVHATGSLAGAPLHATFAPQVQFDVNQLEIQPVVSGSAPPTGQAPAALFASSTAGSVTGRRYQATFLSLGVGRLSVAAARWIAVGALAMLMGTLLWILVLMRPREREESEAILARYSRLIVPVERVWQSPGVAVIDVTDIDALARIAEHYDRSILHELAAEGEDAFWVTDESGHFRYAPGAWQADPEIPEPDYPADLASEVAPVHPADLASEAYVDELELGGLAAVEPPVPAQTLAAEPTAESEWASYEAAHPATAQGDRAQDTWEHSDARQTRPGAPLAPNQGV